MILIDCVSKSTARNETTNNLNFVRKKNKISYILYPLFSPQKEIVKHKL